jgi:N-acetylglucosamine-6-sulfatase
MILVSIGLRRPAGTPRNPQPEIDMPGTARAATSRLTGTPLRTALALSASLLIAAVLLTGLAAGSGAKSHRAAQRRATQQANVVFILADDLSWNLISPRFTPNILALERRGETFTRYFVADSLCCPSRSSIFTGLYPHDTKVATNLPPDGGFQKFQSQHLDRRTWALALHRRGYQTSMMGKYLNGYGDPMTPVTAPVSPGWSDWHVSNSTGYLEFNYQINDNARFDRYGGPTGSCRVTGTPDNYGVDVLNADARAFIDHVKRSPFAIEVATFAPHAPYIPAERNACDFPNLKAPHDPSFDTANINPPAWLAKRTPLGAKQIAALDKAFLMRAQATEAVDKLVGDVEAKLAADHLTGNTYIVFSSDNGYHLGQHMLTRGKKTAFDTDIRVPLIIAGPGVPAGKTITQVAQNVDLYPTFVQLAGGTPGRSVEGQSLLPLLHPSKAPPRWRTVALVEHEHTAVNPNDPDSEDGKTGGDPTSYTAIRISAKHLHGFGGPVNAVYIEYKDAAHEREYYDINKDPFERVNIANALSRPQLAELHKILVRLERCHGTSACWTAALPR